MVFYNSLESLGRRFYKKCDGCEVVQVDTEFNFIGRTFLLLTETIFAVEPGFDDGLYCIQSIANVYRKLT